MTPVKFSIIIPTCNRAALLQETLEKVAQLDYKKDHFEVIVVDNNSKDRTPDVVKNFPRKKLQLQYVFEAQQGRTFASQAGIEAAKHSAIIFVDDDIHVRPDLLKLYHRYFTQFPKAAMIGGPIIAQFPPGMAQTGKAQLFLKHIPWVFGQVDYGNRFKEIKYPFGLFAGNFALNLANFPEGQSAFSSLLGRKVGKRYLYCEDYELCLRLALEKKKIIYVPELRVENVVEKDRLEWSYIWKRLFNAGIENYIADAQLSGYSAHKTLKQPLEILCVNVVKRRSRYAFWELVFAVPVWLGYVLVGPSILTQLTAEEQSPKMA